MLAGGARTRIPELLDARRAAYAQIARHVDTTNKSIAQIAEEVIALFEAASDEPS
jgi:shikimate kinase